MIKIKILKFFLFLPVLLLGSIQLPFAIIGTIAYWILKQCEWALNFCSRIFYKPFQKYDIFFTKLFLSKEEYEKIKEYLEK